MLRQQTLRTLLAGAFLLVGAAHAQTSFEEDFDDKEKPWQEVAVQLPAPPKAENMLPFYVSPIASNEFAIDAKSVSVGTDGVVRYTLVATSSGGARSVSYEGIRCQSFERKLYAFGQPDGGWPRSRRDQWERINSSGPNRQHAALFTDYFCSGTTVAGKAEDMIDRIRYKRPLSPDGSR